MERQDCNWTAGYRFRVYNPSRFIYGVVASICTGSDESFDNINSRAMVSGDRKNTLTVF
jgi:hypothetical protein